MTDSSKCDIYGCYSKIYKDHLCRSHYRLKMQYGKDLMNAILAVRVENKREIRKVSGGDNNAM